MKFRKNLIISTLFFILVVLVDVKSQTYQHNTIWSRVMVIKQFNQKWMVSGEILYRRQSNYQESSLNFLANPLLETQRLTVAYRYKKWQFSFAPSRWHAYQLLGKESDFGRKPAVEWRFTPGAELFQPLKTGSFQWRTQYEYRSYVDEKRGRFRQRFQYRYPINKSNDLMIGEEVLLGFPPSITKTFEQNQLTFLWLPRFSKHLEAELGYRWIYRKRRNSEERDTENALVVGFFVRL